MTILLVTLDKSNKISSTNKNHFYCVYPSLFGNTIIFSTKSSQFVLVFANMAYSDENTVKTRLLLDGDGNGDDRRINLLAKQVQPV